MVQALAHNTGGEDEPVPAALAPALSHWEDRSSRLEPELQVVLEGVFEKRRFLDLVRHFIVFEDEGRKADQEDGGLPSVPCGQCGCRRNLARCPPC